MITKNIKLKSTIIFKQNDFGILIRNTENASTFSIGKREAFVLQKLDGKNSLEDLKQELTQMMTGKEVEKFVLLIQNKGFLEDTIAQKRFNITRILFPLTTSFSLIEKGLFSKYYVRFLLYGSLLSIIVIGLLLHSHFQEIFVKTLRTNYFKWEILPIYLITILFLGFVHELSHAVTIIDAGGSVFELGFALNYLNPSFYIDITGVHKIPDKNKRLKVWIAGIAIQSIILGPCLCLAFLPYSILYENYILIAVNGINMGMIILNLLFLIKLDGYHILCEFIEIKNLKEKAVDYIEHEKVSDMKNLNILYFIVGWIYKLYLPVFIMYGFTLLISQYFPHLMMLSSNTMLAMTLLFILVQISQYVIKKIRG